MKKNLTILSTILALMMVLAVSISAASAVINPTQDADTHGDWVGKYGAEGYILFAGSDAEDNNNTPAYATVTHESVFGEASSRAVWYDGATAAEVHENDAAALYTDDTATARRAACIYNTNGLNVTVDIGSEQKLVTFYCTDFDSNGRALLMTAYDEDGNELDSADIVEFIPGKYITVKMSGQVRFETVLVEATNVVLSGIFFDADPDAVPAAEVAPAQTLPEVEVAVTEGETLPAVEEAPSAETAPVAAPSTETAPATFDMSTMLVIAAVAAVVIIAKKKVR